MFYLADFKQRKENKNKDTLKTIGGIYLGQQTIRSGLPRALGVRLESHSTSKKNAREILKNGGFLDPNKGGTGEGKILQDIDIGDSWANRSKNRVFLTGIHKDRLPEFRKESGRLPEILHPLMRKLQRANYRGIYSEKVIKNASGVTPKTFFSGVTGLGGRSLYVGGSDKYFNSNFRPDLDDPISLVTDKKTKVFGNRASATVDAIKREGLGNLIKDNPKRVLSGLGILGAGGYGTYKLLSRKTRSDKGKSRGVYK